MAAFALPIQYPLSAHRPVKGLTDSQFGLRQEASVASLAAFTRPRELVFVVPSDGSSYKILLPMDSNQLPAWVKPTISAFIGIQSLPDNWDSYEGKKVSRENIVRSLFVLERIMDEASPVPSIVPLGDGGVQIEWHRKQQDLEITFAADDTPQFFYQNRATGVEQIGFTSEFANLARLLRNLA